MATARLSKRAVIPTLLKQTKNRHYVGFLVLLTMMKAILSVALFLAMP